MFFYITHIKLKELPALDVFGVDGVAIVGLALQLPSGRRQHLPCDSQHFFAFTTIF
jgi:hypothetical protein